MPIRINYLVLVVMSLLLLVACGSDPDVTLEQAKKSASNGETRVAIIELKSLLQQTPDNTDVRMFLAQLYNDTYQYESAEKELRKAASLGLSNSPELHVELANALYFQGKEKELVAETDLNLDYSDQQKASLLGYIGQANLALDEREVAEKNLQEGLAIDASNPELGILEAKIAAEKGKPEDALASISKVTDANPKYLHAQLFKGSLLRALGRGEDELAVYEHILSFDPTNVHALAFGSTLLVALSRIDEAEAQVRLLEKNYPDIPQTKVRRGLMFLDQGQFSQALDQARLALTMNPQSADANFLFATAARQVGSISQANEALKIVIERQPGNLSARVLRGQILLDLNEPQTALEIVEPILNLGFENSAMSTVAGLAHQALGNVDQANTYFDRALEEDPKNNYAELYRALGTISSGDVQGGEGAFVEALMKADAASSADEVLVLEVLRRGDIDRALDYVERIVERNPGQAIPHNLKGSVLAAKKDIAQARVSFEKALEIDPLFVPAATNLVQLDIFDGKVDIARGRYEKMLEIAPDHIDALMALADFEYVAQNKTKAITLVEQAVKSDPTALIPALRLIDYYVFEGDPKRAAEVGLAALESHPNNGTLIAATAQSQLLTGENESANRMAKRLENIPGVTPLTYTRLARFQFQARLPREAEKTLRNGLRAFPTDTTIHAALVKFYFELRRVDEAKAHAESVQSSYPDSPFGYMLMGEVAELAKDYEAAVAHYNAALQRQQFGQLAAKRYFAASHINEPEALAQYIKWVDEHPNDAVGRARLADVFAGKGEYLKAIGHYEKLIENKTYSIENLNTLAWSYMQVEDPRALSVAEAAYSRGGNLPHVADTLGWILLNQGDAAGARPYLEKAVRLKPQDPEMRYHLGVALKDLGEVDAAKIHLQQALDAENVTENIKVAVQQLIQSLN